MWREHASWEMTYPDICYVMQCNAAENRVHSKRYMHLVSVDHCLFFIQIMIRTRELKIKQKDGLITLKYIPASMKIVFFYGC